ncbi:Flagellar biosynthesis protein FliR [Rickettsiales endosymbiont of Paramecium tredecaurelia]|uniref:flagellar biosynthetic protein FliR n=1 Tax=Candidatus Sarmatiella mevalonica TaxID=2770581 RepID=UPI001921CCBB|nr:flagellar biosynthetic protein FliR [Candidatus Sarmatiella mevalonica]MBL3284692.1 Flagellar biosynthesis protein FliR [Candidatus Sarmatiella mevalonica]
MLNGDLDNLVFSYFLVICRLASMIVLTPALGDRYISNNIKIPMILAISFVILPVVHDKFTHLTQANLSQKCLCIFAECIIGVILGIGMYLYFLTIELISQIFAMQSSLSSATFFNPSLKIQIPVFGTFLVIYIVNLIFVTNSHHIFIEAFVESYDKFNVGQMLKTEDMSHMIVRLVGNSFILSFKLSAPCIIVSLALSIGGGILARLMPNLQIFFLITPVQALTIFGVFYLVFINISYALLEQILEIAQFHL